MDPQQEVFIAIRKAISDLGYSVFDGKLPPEDTKYPFVYMGYTQQVDQRTKSQTIGTVYQRVDVWHDDFNRRGDVSAMMLAIKLACFRLTRTPSYSVDVSLNSQDIQSDNSTRTSSHASTSKTLMRGMLEFKADFS